MPSFADVKAKAVKVKDASVSKMQHTKDRHTSVPMKKTNWDPYSGNAPPPLPPPRTVSNTRPQMSFPPPPPAHNRPSPSGSPSPASSARPSPPPPPTRSPALSQTSDRQTPLSPPPPLPRRTASTSSASSGPPPVIRSTRPGAASRPSERRHDDEEDVDWASLSREDKEVFFSWLDEFFSKTLHISIPPR